MSTPVTTPNLRADCSVIDIPKMTEFYDFVGTNADFRFDAAAVRK
jgi:hypothetical protein